MSTQVAFSVKRAFQLSELEKPTLMRIVGGVADPIETNLWGLSDAASKVVVPTREGNEGPRNSHAVEGADQRWRAFNARPCMSGGVGRLDDGKKPRSFIGGKN